MNSENSTKPKSENDNLVVINQELEKLVEKQRLKIDRLTEENKFLEKEVLRERRLRYAARNIVVGVDKAIIAQIERLQSGSNDQSVKTLKQHSVSYSQANKLEDLVDNIQEADLNTYYSRDKDRRKKNFVTYKIVKQAYFIPRHIVAVPLKGALKIRKKFRKEG